jgi:hypothetical protein
VDDQSLDGKRLAFEERKWDADSKLRELEVAAKQRESSWTGRLFSPLTTTLMAGILTIAGTATATLLQGWSTLQLETKKYESSKMLETEKQQHELILKMASVGDIEQARKNVRFLAETGLITDVELAKKILASKETPVLPRPSGLPNSPVVLPMPVAPEELLRRMSPEAINMVINFEVKGRDGYEARFKNPVWVGFAGGVTIGIGYDLGSITEDVFRRDWGSHLTSTELDQLASMVGLRGSAAKAAVAKVSEITVRWEGALAVFTNSVLPRYATIIDAQLPNAKELPADSYGALVSLVYNRGAAFNATGSRHDEMRNIRDLIDKRDFASISAQIRSMKRLWPDTPLAVRREREALLFEKGFAPDDAQVRGLDPSPIATP